MEQELLFNRMKEIKDYYVKTAVKALNPDADLIWSDFEDAYKALSSMIHTPEEKEAYTKVMNELFKYLLHSLLVMIDGEDSLHEKLQLDLIDKGTGESMKGSGSLNEGFMNYLAEHEA